MPGIGSPSLSSPATGGSQESPLTVMDYAPKKSTSFLLSGKNAQGKKCSRHSCKETSDKLPYRNQDTASTNINRHYVEKHEEWVYVR